jgi:hypothetical protein
MATDWFAVHKQGLAAVLARRGREFAVLELIQNAWDAPGVTEVIVTLEPIAARRGLAMLQVVDDAPGGFADLRRAYTLYAPTEKRADPAKRGRWTLGEKLVLALCEEAEIVSTNGRDLELGHFLGARRWRGDPVLEHLPPARSLWASLQAAQAAIEPYLRLFAAEAEVRAMDVVP